MHIAFIGITLFALFFGAGNLIFPVMLGQLSGENFGIASFGFVITGVVMPLLGVIALGFSGEKDFLKITQRGGTTFGLIFATTLYLTIGPLFAMPRTGSVSYEIAIQPFVNEENNTLFLAIFTFCYFGLSCLLSINPNKIIDIVGKILTPLMLIFILILIIAAVLYPMGKIQPAVTQEYQTSPFFTGFTNGYLTMDTLASFIFGIIVVYSIVSYGIRSKTKMMIACVKSSLIAGAILAFIYISLSYIGASSVEKLGILDNGGKVLAQVSTYYFGIWGNLILGAIVAMACITTNIGLTNACANYLLTLYPRFSYCQYAILFSIISGLFANIGLSLLISISIPVLSIIYPVTIILIILTFAHRLFNGYKSVYIGAIYCTLFISIIDAGAKTILVKPYFGESIGIELIKRFLKVMDHLFNTYLPFYSDGIGWIIPSILGAILGYVYSRLFKKAPTV